MSLEQLTTIDAIREFLDGTQAVAFGVAASKEERYRWVRKTLVELRYYQLGTADKGVVTRYLMKVTGYSLAQVKRLIKQYRQTGTVTVKTARRNGFKRRYSAADIRLLATMDERHNQPGGPYSVARLLEKLRIEFTKSRPRHSNDNALAESKNGSVVRKLYGYRHIPQQYAADFAELDSQQVYRYINFHRPCYFPTIITDHKGKEHKKYRYDDL